MRTIVKDEKFAWKAVKSGMAQGSVVTPIMFIVYINDMLEGIDT